MHPARGDPSCKWRSKVFVRAGVAFLVVTASHRVMIRPGGQDVSASAGSLRVGDHILCNNGMHTLTEATHMQEETEVVEEIAFVALLESNPHQRQVHTYLKFVRGFTTQNSSYMASTLHSWA